MKPDEMYEVVQSSWKILHLFAVIHCRLTLHDPVVRNNLDIFQILDPKCNEII